MALYVSNAYLVDQGKIVKPNETLTLAKDQADKLGKKVKPATVADLSKLKLADLQAIAKGDNVQGYSTLNKDQLVAKLAGTEQKAETQAPAEQPATDQPAAADTPKA